MEESRRPRSEAIWKRVLSLGPDLSGWESGIAEAEVDETEAFFGCAFLAMAERNSLCPWADFYEEEEILLSISW